MKILFVSRKFDGVFGGVERMSIALMNEMCARGHEVHLLSWDHEGAAAFYEMDEHIQWHKMALGNPDHKASFGIKLKRAQKTRAVVKEVEPDVIIAFQDGAFRAARIYTIGMGVPVIAAERNAPSRFDHIKLGKHKEMIFQSFRLAKKITVQCESYRGEYPPYLRSRIAVIANPVAAADKFAAPAGNDNDYTLLSVGRLGYQKNYPVLLEAFRNIYQDFPDWKLVIVGDGEDRQALAQYIGEHDLSGCIRLAGETQDVESYYCKSHLFCLPSRWEGFPNALAEAMSHGLPVVGFAGCSGVRDIVDHGGNGLLAEGNADPQTLAETLRQLMKDADLRDKMGQEGIQDMAEYKPELIFDLWENLFKEVAGL